MKSILILVLCLTSISLVDAQVLCRTNNAKIQFVSSAPLELIKAESNNCQGILSPSDGEFVFRVFVKTFDGFNNPIQKEHFYENYLETTDYPEAMFQGFVLEKIDLDNELQQDVRAKGDLTIHGVTNEKIINVSLTKTKDGHLDFQSEFMVQLEEYNIDIPKIVKQKIAEIIKVTVSGQLIIDGQ